MSPLALLQSPRTSTNPALSSTSAPLKVSGTFKMLWQLISGDGLKRPLVAAPYLLSVVYACVAGAEMYGWTGATVAFLLNLAAWTAFSYAIVSGNLAR